MRTVLVVAAEAFELRWIRPGRGDLRFVKVANGPGPRLVEQAVEQVREPVDAVLSTGICGALDPSLRVGDIVVGLSVNGEPAGTPKLSGCFRTGPILSMDRVAGTADEKKLLAASGAIAVEMEAAAVLSAARRRDVPFYCIRAVSDTAEETFAVDLNAARGRSGRFSVPRIAAQAARKPLVIVPELLRLRRNAVRAAKALGDFVADCDF
jgi:adenosylhomocysteine nucleosidase